MATSTGTVTLRATFANDDEALFPNEFVNVNLLVDTLQNAVLVPTPAVLSGAPGDYVYLVNADQTVSVHKVTLGPSDGKNTVIVSGLAAGQIVVTDGMDRLSDGAKIKIGGAKPSRWRGRRPRQRLRPARSARAPAPPARRRRKRRARSDEHFPPVRPQAGGDFAADGRAGVGGPGRRALSADFIAAGRRLSDDPGADLLSRRKSHGDGDHRDRAAGSAAGGNPRPAADDLEQLGRRLHHHPAIRSVAQSRHRRSRTCRKPSTRPTACCPRACRRRRRTPRSIRPISPSSRWRSRPIRCR